MSRSRHRLRVDQVPNPQVLEAAHIAGVTVFHAVGVFHAICESARDADADGRFETTPRRLAALSGEPLEQMQALFAALTEVGLILDGVVLGWKNRKPPRSISGGAVLHWEKYRRPRRRGAG